VAEFVDGDHEQFEEQEQEEVMEEGAPDPDQVIRFGPAPPPGHGRDEAAGSGDPDSAVDDGIGTVAGEGLHELLGLDYVVASKGDEAGDADSEEQRIGVKKRSRRRGEEAPIHIEEQATEDRIGAAGHRPQVRAEFLPVQKVQQARA